MNNKRTPMEQNDKEFYITSDLAGSAVLVTAGYRLVRIDRSDLTRKANFIFLRKKGIEKIMDDYWANALKLNPRTFWDNTKMLKNRLYSGD